MRSIGYSARVFNKFGRYGKVGKVGKVGKEGRLREKQLPILYQILLYSSLTKMVKK